MTVLSEHDPLALAAAAHELGAGRPVVLPTDTVYGLAARAHDAQAVTTIFDWKGRPAEQVVAVLVASAHQAFSLGRGTEAARALAAAFWPGPLTIVLDRIDDGRLELGGPTATVGVRWPAADFAVALAERVGPLATTSANRHGQTTPATAAGALAQLDQPTALAIDGGALSGRASTVVNATGPDPHVLRTGPISSVSVRAAAR